MSDPIIRVKLNITIILQDKYRNFGKLDPSSFALILKRNRNGLEIFDRRWPAVLQYVWAEGHVL